jgi:hypothetical protein
VPKPRRADADADADAELTASRQKETADTTVEEAGTPGEPTTAGGMAAKPTLVSLVREYLSENSEPRSAAEITTALAHAHPDRTIKITVVRTTTEGLVAKGQAQRTKQGGSVFYATSEHKPARPAAGTEPAAV